MFYLLSNNLKDEKTDINLKGTIYDQNNEIVEEIFDEGEELDDDQLDFTIVVNTKHSLINKRTPQDKICTSVIESGFLFLISPKTHEFFETQAIKNLQFANVTFKYGNNPFLGGYKIVNILDKIDCADHKKSDLDYFDDGDISFINKLIIDETKIPKDLKILLLGRYLTGKILVREDLKEAIEKEGLSGFRFEPLS